MTAAAAASVPEQAAIDEDPTPEMLEQDFDPVTVPVAPKGTSRMSGPRPSLCDQFRRRATR